MTLLEFCEVLDARMEDEQRRERGSWYLTAWQTAHLLNMSGKQLKRSVTADTLLGLDKKGEGQRMSPEEKQKTLNELREKFRAPSP